MQPGDRINKSSWMLHENVKNTVVNNVVTAARNGQITIEPNVLERLLAIINMSADEGYHRGHRTFTRAVAEALSESSDVHVPAAPRRAAPESSKATKKK